jgi:hypothetical protein
MMALQRAWRFEKRLGSQRLGTSQCSERVLDEILAVVIILVFGAVP